MRTFHAVTLHQQHYWLVLSLRLLPLPWNDCSGLLQLQIYTINSVQYYCNDHLNFIQVCVIITLYQLIHVQFTNRFNVKIFDYSRFSWSGVWLLIILLFTNVISTSVSILNCPRLKDHNGEESLVILCYLLFMVAMSYIKLLAFNFERTFWEINLFIWVIVNMYTMCIWVHMCVCVCVSVSVCVHIYQLFSMTSNISNSDESVCPW